jgi:branched-subunit amino acid aminotransferase/4-amino-4-deoxychorismate lyase
MSDNETVFSKNRAYSPTWFQTNSVVVPNRAMNFGDGLFETMVFDGVCIRFGNLHLARLEHGLKILKMDASEVDFFELEAFLQAQFGGQKLRIRWNLYRAGAGKYTPIHPATTTQSIQISSFTVAPNIKNSAYISTQTRLFPTAWSGCKTLNALPYILANIERQELGMDEVILLDHRGFLSEAGASNLFWTKSNKVFTPSLACSCLDGVARKVILAEFERQNIPVEVGEFLPSELDQADQVWVCNVTGVSYIAQIGNQRYTTSPFYMSPI